MKLSDIESQDLKKDQPEELEGVVTHDILDVLGQEGITVDMLVDSAMGLYFPHPGIETRELAEKVFKRELKIALSDPNLCLLIYSGILLEREGIKGQLPNVSKSSYEKDLTFIVADEVLGTSLKCSVQIEARHAARGTNARLDSQFVESHEHDRPVIFLGQARRDDADHARMPTAIGQNQRGIIVGVESLLDLLLGRQIDAAFQTVSTGIQLV